MEIKLVVVRPFGPHARGDVLTGAAEVARVLESENAADVVKVVAGEEE